MKHFSQPSFRWTLVAVSLVLMLALPWAAMAAVWTDEQDYTPGSVVAIYGDNSDNAGYLAGETVNVSVVGPNGYSASCDVIADENGAWSCQVTLPLDESAVGHYTYTAVGQTSGVSQSGTFTDSPKVGSVVVGSQVGTLTYGTAGSVTYTVTVYRGTAEAAFDANLCIKTALPTGASASFSVTPVSFALKEVSKTSTLTITTSSATPAGTTLFTVRAFIASPATCTGTTGDYAEGTGTLSVSPGDTTPPTSTITLNPATPNGNNDWYISNVHVTVSATDNAGGSGVAETRCVLDPVSVPATFDDIPVGCAYTGAGADVTTDGQHTVYAASKDNVGNKETPKSADFKIDKTAPTISFVSRTAPNANGWNNTDVTVNWSCADILSGPVSASVNQTVSSEGQNQSATGTCQDLAGNTASNIQTGINIDKTAPTASASASPAPNANGWNNTDVDVSFSGSDALSGIDFCSDPVTLSSEGSGQSAYGTCTDKAGNVSDPATATGINIDKTPPTFGACPAGGPFLLNSGPQSVGPIEVNAAISGLNLGLSTLSGSVDTSSVGTKSVTFTAVDNADNSATTTCGYSVIYNWNGFFRPVDNLPTLNVAKAGSAIPVKFSLSGYQGLSIFQLGYPLSRKIECDTKAPVDAIEETVTAGGSSLNYDASADQYVYVWKTDKAWAGTCRQLVVILNDGMAYQANFHFTR